MSESNAISQSSRGSTRRSHVPRDNVVCRTCSTCRRRKVRCDGQQPHCGACRVRSLDCEYPQDARRTAGQNRKATLKSLQRQVTELRNQLGEQAAPSAEVPLLPLDTHFRSPTTAGSPNTPVPDGYNTIQERTNTGNFPRRGQQLNSVSTLSVGDSAPDQHEDLSSSPEPTAPGSEMRVYGATSLLHHQSPEHLLTVSPPNTTEADKSLEDAARDQLVSQAAVGRQKELHLFSNPSIIANIDFDGVPVDLAMHLLDLHWNRQHLSYLLTYRPAIMDSLFNNGPYVNKLLLNAIYLQSSLYSDREDLQLHSQTPQPSSTIFYDRFRALLTEFIDKPTTPTVVALLTCGACLVPHGKQSAGWLYCGMAYRMIIDLGYHLDISPIESTLSSLDLEIRKRVYWGAYVSDIFQSLFLGRQPALRASESTVSQNYLDSYEEMEEWKPYIDLEAHVNEIPVYQGRPAYAISTFGSLLQLCKIAEHIINTLYSVNNAKTSKTAALQTLVVIRQQLNDWRTSLPVHLQFDPDIHTTPPPHQITPHTTFWTLVILTEQGFLNRGHFPFSLAPVAQEESRQRCVAAALKIWKLVQAYKSAFTLRRAQYGISYATYCAVLVMLQHAHEHQEDHNECIEFFWFALLDYQKGCNSALKRPLKLLKSLMHRLGKVVKRSNVSESGADFSGASATRSYRDSAFEPEMLDPEYMEFWDSTWASTVPNDFSFTDDSIFGIFTQE